MAEPDKVNDPALRGAAQTEYEVGLETRFFKNRYGLNVTYWDRTNKDFPYDVPVSSTSGYGTKSVNVGKISKRGIEVQVFLNPVRTKNFDWNINASFGRLLENKIDFVAPGIPIICNNSSR